MKIARSGFLPGLLLIAVMFWLSAPLLHLLHEHGEEEGDHESCSLFHNLGSRFAEHTAEQTPSMEVLERFQLPGALLSTLAPAKLQH
ncbi:MAG: hypothetical protein QGG33_07285, partial [Candidatus Krumholzibacteria bacterium]|nr:hypothetical protein [Candidatus Krumholzibacteria bacterium]